MIKKAFSILGGSIRYKLMLHTLLISALVALSLYFFLSRTVTNTVAREQLYNDASSFNQVNYYYQNYFKNAEVTLGKLVSNSTIHSLLSLDASRLTMLDLKGASDRLNNELLESLPATPIVEDIFVIGANGLSGSYSSSVFTPASELPGYEQIVNNRWFIQAIGLSSIHRCTADNLCSLMQQEFPSLFDSLRDTIYYTREITRDGRRLGLLIATFKREIWNETIANYPFPGTAYVFNEHNELLWSSHEPDGSYDSAVAEAGRLQFDSKLRYGSLELNGRRYLMDYAHILNGKLKILHIFEPEPMNSLLKVDQRTLFGLVAAYLASLLLISYCSAGIVSRQLMLLSNSLKNAMKNQEQIPTQPVFRDLPPLRKWPLRTKIMAYFGLTILLPSLLIIVLTIYRTSELLNRNMQHFTTQIVQTANTNVDLFLRDYELLLNNIAYSPQVQAILDGDAGGSDKIRQLLLESTMLRKEILAIHIYDASGNQVFSASYPGKSYYEDIGGSLLLRSQVEKSGKMYYYRSGIDPYLNAVQVFAKNVFNVNAANAKDVFGYVTVDIDESMLGTIYGNILIGDTGFFRILDASGGDVLANPDTRFELNDDEKNVILRQTEGSFVKSGDGSPYLVSFDTSPSTRWKTIGIVPTDEIAQRANSLVLNGAILFGGLIAAITLLIYYYSGRLTKPLETLRRLMRKIEGGETDVRMNVRGMDEIYVLGSSFNLMIEKLNELIFEVYESKMREKELLFLEKEAQLNALQQQVNPHFLYNTLESINWLAYRKGVYEICDMSSALGAFFRGNISNRQEFLTIRQEIDHIKTYLVIQKIRYAHKFDIVWDIGKEIEECRIPKLSLQPLIENSILHGLEHTEAGGIIAVTGRLQDDTILIRIRDNGKGIQEERLQELMRSLEQGAAYGGVGLGNVYQRMRLVFGSLFSFAIESSEESGTTILLRYPAFTEERYGRSQPQDRPGA